MGSTYSRDNNPRWKEVEALKEKVNHLEREIDESLQVREKEMMMRAYEECEWKRERKKLRKMLEENEKRVREMEEEKIEGDWECCWEMAVEEKMREETEWRDEAVERWKRLYLAIKVELDDLVQRTSQGERLRWKEEEEDLIEELKSKEEKIRYLQERLALMEQEKYKCDREVDILRQSLRIMTHNYMKQQPASKGKSLSKAFQL